MAEASLLSQEAALKEADNLKNMIGVQKEENATMETRCWVASGGAQEWDDSVKSGERKQNCTTLGYSNLERSFLNLLLFNDMNLSNN
jgi:hypothetical protein